MPTWRVEFSSAGSRQFLKLPREAQKRIMPHIEALAVEPHPQGAAPLAGTEGLWRIRIGAYRVVYTDEDDRLVVLVVKIGHRRDVYRGL